MLQGQKSGGTALDELSSASTIEGHDNHPQWFADAQNEARKEFADEPYPSRKHEFWRFSSVKNPGGGVAVCAPRLCRCVGFGCEARSGTRLSRTRREDGLRQ